METSHMNDNLPTEQLRRKNVRLALALAALALLVFVTSIPYWAAILKAVGNQF